MDIGAIVKRAWDITWRYKILWVFGLIVALTSGGLGNSVTYQMQDGEFPNLDGWIIVLLVIVGLLVALGLAVLSIIAQGALIDGARQAEEDGAVKGSAAWRVGTGRFWPMLGIRALMALAGLVLAVPLILMVLLAVVPASSGVGSGEAGIIAALCGVALCCVPLVPIGIALSIINQLADRACVLDGLKSVDALKKGWELLKANLGEVLLVAVVQFVIGLIVGAVMFGGVMLVAIPTGGLAWLARRPMAAVVPLLCLGSLWALVSLAVGALLQTFLSSIWTLAYRGLAGQAAPAVAAAPELDFLETEDKPEEPAAEE